MHPLVRDLYRRILLAGRDYPRGIDYVRERAKREMRESAHLPNELELKRKVNYGRYMVREMLGVARLKKYRAMRQRYGANAPPTS